MRITAVTTLVPTAESVTGYAIRLLSNTLFIQNNVCTGSITGNVFKKVGSQEQQLVCGTECRVQFKWDNSSSWLEADYMSGVFLDTAFLSGSYNGGKTVQIRATNRAGDTVLQQEVIFPNFAGNNGSAGPLPYLAGEWNVATSYTRTETKCPIVVYSNQYYFLRKIGTVTGGNNPAYEAALPNGKWIHADNFQMVITECLMAAFGKIASAVFSGDYMISQYGISGDDRTPSQSYTNFRDEDEDPYSASNSFLPNVCIDFMTGKAWFGAGSTHFNSNGAAVLANGNLLWDSFGNLTTKGNLKSKLFYQDVDTLSGNIPKTFPQDFTGSFISINNEYSGRLTLENPANHLGLEVYLSKLVLTRSGFSENEVYNQQGFLIKTNSGWENYYKFMMPPDVIRLKAIKMPNDDSYWMVLQGSDSITQHNNLQ